MGAQAWHLWALKHLCVPGTSWHLWEPEIQDKSCRTGRVCCRGTTEQCWCQVPAVNSQ